MKIDHMFQIKIHIMKAKRYFKFLLSIATLIVFLSACSDDDDDDTKKEFIASSSDFTNFSSWTKLATKQGPDARLGAAHAGNDSTATRTVYIKENNDRNSDDEFPIGTIIVKDVRDKDNASLGVTAMVKRGNDFNPDHNDWEWFLLTTDGKIAQDNGADLRGAQLLGGACGSCHSQNKSKDFVFTK